MSSKLRLFTKRFFIYSNVIVVFIFILSCLVPYLNPQTWWFISFFGLAFPFLLLLVIFFLLGWLMILKPRLALISFVALLVGIKSIAVFFAFHNPRAFTYDKEPGTLRVVSWNVARFIELKRNTNKGSETRLKMFELLKQQNADVLCLQEFHTSTNPEYYNNIEKTQKKIFFDSSLTGQFVKIWLKCHVKSNKKGTEITRHRRPQVIIAKLLNISDPFQK